MTLHFGRNSKKFRIPEAKQKKPKQTTKQKEAHDTLLSYTCSAFKMLLQ